MKKTLTTILAAAALAALPALAANAEKDAHGGHHGAAAGNGSASEVPFTEGEVRKVDKGAGKITLKHGPITNLDMPPMTMVFKAKDPAMLDKVKSGDKVRFKVDKVQGAYTVLEIQPAK